MKKPLRLLLIEDSKDDAELICLELERGGFDPQWSRVETEAEFASALDDSWDLICSDFKMPTFDGLRAFELFKRRDLETPFIFVSGALGEDRAVTAMRAGARDYLLKGDLKRLAAVVHRELAEAESRSERKKAEAAARREQRRLALVVEASGAGVFEYALPYGSEAYVSRRWAEILGFSRDELPTTEHLLEWSFERVHPEDQEMLRKADRDFIEGRTDRLELELRMGRKDGSWVEVMAFAKSAGRDEKGRATRVVGAILDRTERHKLEAQLRQAQKMEAIGRLAGGVAHDFNNLLTVIMNCAAYALDTLGEKHPTRQDLKEIVDASKRAASLTSQLLAFSRRSPVSPKVLDIHRVVAGTDRMIRRIVGEDVDVSTAFAEGSWSVRIDPGSLEQVIMNLVVNARDAMPTGGRLTLETLHVELDREYGSTHGASVPAGEYVVLAVSDDGIGMDDETRGKLFEPFFTTKEGGRGTGLGLATCFGIVKQAGGYIWVYSEPGSGSTFRIYLPRVREAAEQVVEVSEPRSLGGSETILVVEDDDQVRRLSTRALARLGYRVLEAADGPSALELSEGHGGAIDLLLTDVVMPAMSGKEVADRLVRSRPSIKVLYTSGYTENAIVHRGVLDPKVHIVPKPFTVAGLGKKVRELLDER